MTTITKKLRSQACQLRLATCEFSASVEQDGVRRAPIKLKASSGAVFNARWWGPLVFDYAGMQWAKDRLALDYCHHDDELVGFADQIDNQSGNLNVSGQLVSTREDDRAAEIMKLGAAGVPYEASIAFDPRNGLVIEEWQPGTSATVNGQQIAGPVTVVRQCLLRGIAVCPHGADPYTESEFSAGESGEVLLEFEFQLSKKEPLMPKSAPGNSAEMNPPNAVPPVVPAADLRAELRAEHAAFTTKYGSALAAQWGPLGECELSMDSVAAYVRRLQDGQAAELAAQTTAHTAAVAEIQTKLDAQTAAVTDLTTRLAAVQLGETKPVSTAPASAATAADAELAAKLSGRLPEGIARFAAGIKLPKS